MKPCRELRIISTSLIFIFILTFVAGLISCSLRIWTIAAAVFFASILVALTEIWVLYLHVALQRQFGKVTKNARKLDVDLQAPRLLSLAQAVNSLLEIIANMHEERSSLKKQTEQLLGQTQALDRQKQNLHIQEADLQRQIHDLLSHINSGICFLDENGVIRSPLSDSFQQMMKEFNIEKESMKEILSASTNTQKGESLKQWLDEILDSEAFHHRLSTEEMILPFSTTPGDPEKFLQFSFVLLDHKNSQEKVLVEIVDATSSQNLREELRLAEEKQRTSMECACEIAKADVSLLNDFLKEVKSKIGFFKDSIDKLRPGCFSGVFIADLHDNLQNVKSDLKLLQFKALADRAKKLQTLLKIVREASGKLSSGQAQEIKECLGRFVSLLEDYTVFGESLYSESPSCKQGNGSLLFPERQFRYLVQSALSGTSSPPELIRYVRKMQEKLAPSAFSREQVFEFIDLLDRVWETLSRKMREREVKLEIELNPSRILLYGDHFKIMELVTMVMHASLLRGEITSGLKVSCSLIPREDKTDILELETNVSIRNTSRETLEKLTGWKQTGKKFSHQCQGELITHKRGFRLHLPLVINKSFPSPLKIALMGSCLYEIEGIFDEVSRWFPFSLEIITSPSDYAKIDIVVAEAKAMETLGWHIQEKRREANHIIPLIALVPTDDEKIRKQMLQYGADECLKFPLALSELRWCLFFCLDIIIRAKKASK